MGEQITVWHPHLPGMTRQVPVDDLAAWLSSGWLESAPSIPSQQGNPPRTPGATEGVALGELKGPKPADGVPLEVAVEVTPEQLREQLLDCQIAAGAISLQEKTEDAEGA